MNDELTPFNLVDPNQHLLLEQFAIGKQPRNSFLHQVVGSPACFRRKLVQLGFLSFR